MTIAILPEIDARFLELRAQGLTTALIAKALDRGEAWVKKRPAVLEARGVAVPPVRIGRPQLDPAAPPVAKRPLAPQPRRAPPPSPVPAGVDLFALRDRQCRWPVDGDGDGAATRFCAAPSPPGEPYCPCHRAAAWRPRTVAPAGQSR